MGSSKKRKKEKKADFVKKRLKVGKPSKGASNAIKTDFTARQLVLPTQSVAVAKGREDEGNEGEEAAGASRQELMDCLTQTNHYSASVRKSAIFKIKEIVRSAKGEVIMLRLGAIMTALGRLIADEDKAVRKEILDFFVGWVPSLDPALTRSFASTLVIHTTSAMTNLYQSIRLDAVKILALWLEQFPTHFALDSEYGKRVLDCYFALLKINMGPVQNSSVPLLGPGLPMNDRRLLFKTLSQLIKAVYTAEAQEDLQFAFEDVNSKEPKQADGYTQLIWSIDGPGTQLHTYSGEQLFRTVKPLKFGLGSSEESKSQDKYAENTVFAALIDLLISSWLESAPTYCAPDQGVLSSKQSPHPVLEILLSIVEIFSHLQQAMIKKSLLLDKTTTKKRNLLVEKISAYFPIDVKSGMSEVEQRTVLSLNLHFCDIGTRIVMIESPDMIEKTTSSMTKLGSRIVSYLADLLETPLQRQSIMSTRLYTILWTVLTHGKDSGIDDLYHTLVKTTIEQRSPDKRSVKVINALMSAQINPLQKIKMRDLAVSRLTSTTDKWIMNLPKILWSSGSSEPSVTADVIQALSTAVKGWPLMRSIQLDELTHKMEPFFVLMTERRGLVYGPFRNLELDIQERVLDCVYYLLLSSARTKEGSSGSTPTSLKLVQAIKQACASQGEGELLSSIAPVQDYPSRLERLISISNG